MDEFTKKWGQKVIGSTLKSYDDKLFTVVSHDRLGFHLQNVANPDETRCISERAVNRTYYDIRSPYGVPYSYIYGN